MTMESEPGHGSSPAAWTAVVIMLLAFTIGTLAFWFDIAWLVWASAALLVVGAFVGWLLAKLGYGVRGPRYAPKKVHN
jgi:membrane protein YdbS with pleckstrin-like domain